MKIVGNKEATQKTLFIKKNGMIFSVQLNDNPVEIKRVSNDSIFLHYFIFSGTEENTQYESMEGKLVIVQQFHRVDGTVFENEFTIDKAERNKNTIFFYSKGGLVDSFSRNSLLYTDTYFFKRDYDSIKHRIYTTVYLTKDKGFAQAFGQTM
ncbi:MAG: hypothetical protein ACTHMD_03465 [Flavisolibacter sp.]